eukprot:g26140.t1
MGPGLGLCRVCLSDDLGVAVHFCRTVLKHGFFGGKQCIGFEFEALTAVLLGLFAATWFEGWRELMIDLLDPLFVVRSDADKALPGKQRETLRRCSWACCLVCGAVAMWDIMLHPVEEGLFELPSDMLHGLDDGLSELWDPNTMLLFRWKPGEGRGLPWGAMKLFETSRVE